MGNTTTRQPSAPRLGAQRATIAIATGDRNNRIAWNMTRALIWGAGGRALRTSPNRPLREEAGALVLLGGTDVAPSRYNAPLDPRRGIDTERDAHELALLDSFTADQKPVLGICRGAQLINVARGGELARVVPRRRRTPAPRRRLRITSTSRLARILGTQTWTNSLHTFSVSKLGENVRVVGRDAGGVVQAIEVQPSDAESRFLVGVQWHPELMPYLKSSRKLFRALVLASRQA